MVEQACGQPQRHGTYQQILPVNRWDAELLQVLDDVGLAFTEPSLSDTHQRGAIDLLDCGLDRARCCPIGNFFH